MSSKRDPFIDGLRAISVLRVISLHLVQRVELPIAAAFSFFMPGMPLMFFVSGALAAKSLQSDAPGTRARFWKARARRLFLPFWAFGVVIVGVCLVGQRLSNDAAHAFPLARAWCWVLPLAGPQASAAYDKLDWHLWFLSSLLLLLAGAPWLLALHRRLPWSGACAFFAVGALLEFMAVSVPDVVRNTLLFGAAFQLGFAFADGRVARARTGTLLAAAFCLCAFALAFYARRAPGAMLHAVPLALVSLGLGFVALWLALRARATRAFERPRKRAWIAAINRRAYTLYLWGPVANEMAWRALRPAHAAAYALEFAASIGLLLCFVRLFGPVEDWAAKRGKLFTMERAPAQVERQAA